MLNLFTLILCVIPFLMIAYIINNNENVIVYNGVKYPVVFDYTAGRCYCRLFGGVARRIRLDNNYNIFGVVCEVL